MYTPLSSSYAIRQKLKKADKSTYNSCLIEKNELKIS
jgi:hypothetical protein